jgi:hypothetical protein
MPALDYLISIFKASYLNFFLRLEDLALKGIVARIWVNLLYSYNLVRRAELGEDTYDGSCCVCDF